MKKPDKRTKNPGVGSGHTSIYDVEKVKERILQEAWSGKSLTKIEREEWAPTRRAIYDWRDRDPEFDQEIDRALSANAESFVEENIEIKDLLLQGKYDPSAANVAIRHNQWMAMAHNPKRFANKSYVEKKQDLTVTTQHIKKIDITGLNEEQLNAIEAALNARLLTGPDGDLSASGED